MKNLNKFHLSRSLGPNSQPITRFNHHKQWWRSEMFTNSRND